MADYHDPLAPARTGERRQVLVTHGRWDLVELLPEEPDVLCTLCSRPLGIFPEDQPDWPTGPMCGDCYQAREMDNELWWDDQQG